MKIITTLVNLVLCLLFLCYDSGSEDDDQEEW